MKRSGSVLVVCHCVLNANTKIYPLARYAGVFIEALEDYLKRGVGLIQLPCPEVTYLGMYRWGMTREQYDHPRFRRHCREIFEPILDHLVALDRAGCDIEGVVGMDGSPNCGVHTTCVGFTGGELDHRRVRSCLGNLRKIERFGVFMAIVREMLMQKGLQVRFGAVEEQGDNKGNEITW